MNRVKKQLHEWDENLKDDSLPANAVGQALFILLHTAHIRMHTHACVLCSLYFLFSLCFIHLLPSCLLSLRFLLQSSSLSAHRRCSAAPAAEDRQRHPETSL